MEAPRRSLTDFTGRPRMRYERPEGEPTLGERVHVAVVAGALSVAAFAKGAVEFGRELIETFREPDLDKE